jgi:hypothetical protein
LRLFFKNLRAARSSLSDFRPCIGSTEQWRDNAERQSPGAWRHSNLYGHGLAPFLVNLIDQLLRYDKAAAAARAIAERRISQAGTADAGAGNLVKVRVAITITDADVHYLLLSVQSGRSENDCQS